jgi:hypothetical protein
MLPRTCRWQLEAFLLFYGLVELAIANSSTRSPVWMSGCPNQLRVDMTFGQCIAVFEAIGALASW